MISCGVKLSPIKHITTDFETEIQADYISLKIVIPCVVLLFYEGLPPKRPGERKEQ